MKEDQDRPPSQNIRESIQSNDHQDKSLYKLIGNALTSNQAKKNRLIFISKALPIIQPIAYSILDSLYEDKFKDNEIVILIDFQNEEIEYLNQYLRTLLLTKPLRKGFDKQSRNRVKVQRLVNLTIDKRKACYVRDGVYAVTNQIFLTDLLRGQSTIHPQHITKIIVKLTQKVKNYYNYYGWLSTLLKIKQEKADNKWKVPIMFVCNQPQHYSVQDDLKEVYRILFCDKVVIWPFGRSQIHKKLGKYRQNKRVKEWQHSLSHSQNQKNIQELLKQLYNFLKKTYAKKYGQSNMPLEDMMYSRVDEQSFQATRGQFNEFQSIKILLSLLQNSNKISILNRIAHFTEKSDCALWNSNNTQIVELIEELVKTIKQSIFAYQKSENKIKVNLKELIVNSEKRCGIISSLEHSDYECQVEIDIKLALRLEQNQKIMELIKVIQTQRTTKQQHKQSNEEPQLRQLQQIIEKSSGKVQKEQLQRWRSILVICNGKQVKNYITRSVKAYQRDNLYLNYLLSLQHSLLVQSSVRLNKLRRIFEKKKSKAGQINSKQSKISQIQRINQFKIILEELLLFEIQQFKTLTCDLQIQMDLLQHELANADKEGTIFQINQQEARVTATFNQKLLKSNFQIIDITKIRLSNLIQNGQQSVQFESQLGKTKVIISQFYRNTQISSFYDIMTRTNPEIVIFYSPNTHLTRSLYIYQIQSNNQNLQSIHIFSYQDSYQTKSIQQEVIREDKAFWQISQKRSQLSQFNQTPFIRVKNLNMRDSLDKAVRAVNGKTLLRNEQSQKGFNLTSIEFIQYRRLIIVDTRQFKSSLPSYLYYYGFQVVPMFLKNGDYILSDEIAVQKKSVNTRDLQNSLKNNRLDEQLKRLNAQFKQYYLLIEFQQQKDCRKQNFSGFQFTKNDREHSESRQLRRKLLQLITKYERVRLIWSTSVKQTCQFFKIIKIDHTQPDLLKFSKAEIEEEVESKPKPLQNIVQMSASKEEEIEDQLNKTKFDNKFQY